MLIERADRDAVVNAATVNTAVAAPLMAADELAKLNELRAAGVLTDAEFAAQKAKLLG